MQVAFIRASCSKTRAVKLFLRGYGLSRFSAIKARIFDGYNDMPEGTSDE